MLQQNKLHSKKKYKMQVFMRERERKSEGGIQMLHQCCDSDAGQSLCSYLIAALISLEEALEHGGGVCGPGLLVLDGFL